MKSLYNSVKKSTLAVLILIASYALASSVFADPANDTCPPAADTLVSDITFVAYDTETTGFSPAKERILEVGAVKFKDGKILEEKTWLINPNHKINYFAQKAHGLTKEELKEYPTYAEQFDEFSAFIKGTVLFAHNARFDVAFIREENKRNGLPQPCEPTLDTLHIYRAWWPDSASHTVKALTEQLDIETGVFHRATDDSRYTIKIFNAGVKEQPKGYTYGQLVKDAGGEMFFSK